MRQMQGGKGGAMGFGRSKAKMMNQIKVLWIVSAKLVIVNVLENVNVDNLQLRERERDKREFIIKSYEKFNMILSQKILLFKA